jgi:hypothetical protein
LKTVPSTEFRKTYPRLTEPVVVTVQGHPIGTWTPTKPSVDKVPNIQNSPQKEGNS